ncbi:MAG: PEP-CTERM sorting domain-containing protein [Sedimentisphaerales bacterium]
MVVKNKAYVCLTMLSLFCFCSVSYAALTNPTLVFKMTADDTTLTPGEQTTVHVWAWIYTPTGIEKPNKGLDTWQLDLSVDNTNVIQIVSDSIHTLAPSPRYTGTPEYQLSSLNNPVTGEVRSVTVVQLVPGAASTAGVGFDDDIDNLNNYTEICRFTIQAMQAPHLSSATYTIMDEGTGWFGLLADSIQNPTTFDNSDSSAYGGTYFYADGSQNTFTIVPEPATIGLFATAAAFALRRRKLYK